MGIQAGGGLLYLQVHATLRDAQTGAEASAYAGDFKARIVYPVPCDGQAVGSVQAATWDWDDFWDWIGGDGDDGDGCSWEWPWECDDDDDDDGDPGQGDDDDDDGCGDDDDDDGDPGQGDDDGDPGQGDDDGDPGQGDDDGDPGQGDDDGDPGQGDDDGDPGQGDDDGDAGQDGDPDQYPTGCTVDASQLAAMASASWPLSSLTLGATDYSQLELLSLLQTKRDAHADIIVAHTLVSAIVSRERGATVTPEVAYAIEAAHDWLLANKDADGLLPYDIAATPEGQVNPVAYDDGVNIAAVLDAYVTGKLGAQQCQ
jgi:hypothetical protein